MKIIKAHFSDKNSKMNFKERKHKLRRLINKKNNLRTNYRVYKFFKNKQRGRVKKKIKR